MAKFELLPQSENIFLIYKDGWHPAEVASENPLSEWQWTQKRATFSFRNPKKDATLYLEYDARSDLFTPPQQVDRPIGDSVVTTFAADVKEKTLVILPITAAQFGDGEMVEMAIEVDQTFKPGGARSAGARHPGLSRVHRAQVARRYSSAGRAWRLADPSSVVFLDRAADKMVGSLSHHEFEA